MVEIVTRVVFGTMAGGAGGIGEVERESADQHLVRGASERDGPAPQRPEGAEDLHILEGLDGA